MVVLLHVSHFCCPSFYSQNKVALTIIGRGSKGLCSQDARKTAMGAGVGSGGGGGGGLERNSLSISFHPCSSVRAPRHYIPTECTSERLK